MTDTNQRTYLARRAEQERLRASQSTLPAVARVHAEMAEAYERRLATQTDVISLSPSGR